jgi:hypothetical protein
MMCVYFLIQLWKQLTDFNDIWYERYPIEDDPYSYLLKFLELINKQRHGGQTN